ncbi:MAG TPA: pyruvate dehydrogenase (acetyl-transferring) E1 component subunit alpha [Terrimesophilobacter sp.]|nr:pyruvate dehydrogenase (acetyl-transferring) E1 component subunit alpha [Terrimesophilobacter sp.]
MSLTEETSARAVLPDAEAFTLIDASGAAVPIDRRRGYELPDVEVLKELYRRMVIARRWETQVTALTRQGRLSTYPSARGQEASEIGTVMAMQETDWLFPTYRDSIAVGTRGVVTAELLSGFRGDWHSGWDPKEHRIAPQATPLATQVLHAVGLAMAAKLKGDPIATVTFIGDGATSEGDAHEGFNFAGVWQTPTVFIIQNNQFAISVPIAKQTRARMLADKAVGYGIPGYHVDGNDIAAVFAVVTEALDRARSGGGPTMIECLTYRIEPHTNSDDPSRYRDAADVEAWKARDPIARLERYLTTEGALDDELRASIEEESERIAAAMREAMNREPAIDPMELFEHVYNEPRASLLEQRDALKAELEDAHDAGAVS